jgi:DNA-binding transcriptional ArsR family regulator/transcriptional regulator with XRE-family HTH domain
MTVFVNRDLSTSSYGMTEGAGMRIEAAIGGQISRLREARQMSLTQLGQALGTYLGKPWSRQAVHQAERGRRAFTAAEMAALALALDTSVPALFLADAADIELPGGVVSAEDYQGILLYAGDEAPRDGIEELLVALRDIRHILSRPALARLAKIERVAEEVARAGRADDEPARLLASYRDDRHKTRSGPLLMSKPSARSGRPCPPRRLSIRGRVGLAGCTIVFKVICNVCRCRSDLGTRGEPSYLMARKLTVENPPTEVFRALSDPVRWSIIVQMAQVDELACITLEGTLPVSKPTISYHTKILHNAGLISTRKAGRNYYYSLRRDVIRDLLDGLGELAPATRPVVGTQSGSVPTGRRKKRPDPGGIAAISRQRDVSDDSEEAAVLTW